MVDKTQRLGELRRQIRAIEEEIDLVERWGDCVHSLDSFTPEEKIKVFDKLYGRARQYLQSYIEDKWKPKDGEHYLYEAMMTNLLGENVWGLINSIE